MKINFSMITFDTQYHKFKKSLIDSGYIFDDNIYLQSVALFLGFSDIDVLLNNCSKVKNKNLFSLVSSFVKDTFTTSLASSKQERDVIIGKNEDGVIILKEDVLKKYTYQQFKTGVSKVSSYLKSLDINISQSSLLKAFSVFLGYKNWNILSTVIKSKRQTLYNICNTDYNILVESAFLALEENIDEIYFVDINTSHLVGEYLKNVNQLKHKYKVPLKEITKIKSIKKEEINDTLFNGKSLCFISEKEGTSLYIYNQFIKDNRLYQIES